MMLADDDVDAAAAAADAGDADGGGGQVWPVYARGPRQCRLRG